MALLGHRAAVDLLVGIMTRPAVLESRKAVERMQGTQPESAVLNQCRDYLRARGWYVIRLQQGMGCHKGLSDLIAIRAGRVCFIECKTAKGRQSPNQLIFEAAIALSGGEY